MIMTCIKINPLKPALISMTNFKITMEKVTGNILCFTGYGQHIPVVQTYQLVFCFTCSKNKHPHTRHACTHTHTHKGKTEHVTYTLSHTHTHTCNNMQFSYVLLVDL